MFSLHSHEAISPARGRSKVLLVLTVFALTTASWCAHGGFRAPAFDVDTFDYAQMARQVYRGDGFTMLQTFPYVQRFLVEHGLPPDPPWPNTTRFPLIALIEAAAFAVTGPNDLGILLAGGALFLATAIAMFLLANRLFGPWAGILAAVALATEAEQLRLSRSGLLETGAGFFLVMAALALLRATEISSRQRRWAGILGFVLGLAFLQRYDLLAAVPVAVALLFLRSGPAPKRNVVGFSAGFVLAAGPWIARNLATIGSILGSTSVDRNLLGGGILPGDVYMGTQTVNPWAVVLKNWPALVAKFPIGATWMLQHAGELLGGALATGAGLLILAFPVVVRARGARTVWLFLVGVFATRAVLLTLMHNEVRFYLSYTPLVCVLAAGMAAALVRGATRWGAKVEATAAAIASLALLASLPGGPWGPQLPAPAPVFAAISAQVPEGTLVASNHSWLVAWYADRPAVRFSGAWQELVDAEQIGVRIGAVMMRGPSGLDFDADQQRAGGGFFSRRSDFASGYRLWIRRADSLELAGASGAPTATQTAGPEE